MIQTWLRKKLSTEQMGKIFVNGLFEVIENSFPVLVEMIKDDPAFVRQPELSSEEVADFAWIVFAANVQLLESTFDADQAVAIEKHIHPDLAAIFGCEPAIVPVTLKQYQKYLAHLNHPSKNLVYALSKGIFDKYALYQFQDEYFRRLNAPNPLFLKRLDEVTKLFIWDWDAFFKKYKI